MQGMVKSEKIGMTFTKVFKKPTVDAVMASFNEMIVALELIEEQQIDAIEKQNAIIKQAADAKIVAQKEADRAAKAARKLIDLFGTV